MYFLWSKIISFLDFFEKTMFSRDFTSKQYFWGSERWNPLICMGFQQLFSENTSRKNMFSGKIKKLIIFDHKKYVFISQFLTATKNI